MKNNNSERPTEFKPLTLKKIPNQIKRTLSTQPVAEEEVVVEEQPVKVDTNGGLSKTHEQPPVKEEEEEEIELEQSISMKGRKKKYATEEERKLARRIQQREYRIRKANELATLKKYYQKTQRELKKQQKVKEEKIEEPVEKE